MNNRKMKKRCSHYNGRFLINMASKDNHQVEKNHHLIQAMGHAWDGIIDVVTQERNMRYHLLAAVTVIILGFLLNVDRLEWLWLLLAILVVFSAEFLINVFYILPYTLPNIILP